MPTEITAESRLSLSRAAENVRTQQVKEVKPANKVEARQTLSVDGQTVPPAEVQNQVSGQKVEQIATELNQHVQNLKRDLHFSVNEDTGDVVIKVIDSESQETIRTIPSDEVLNMREKLNQTMGILLDAKA